jgi:hypothetical protein
MVKFEADIWGHHFWFVLHSLALTYPISPNAITKRKYYDFIMNLPLFLPEQKIGNQFAELLDSYPVQPYLDNPDSLYRWTWFIHNKINKMLNKPQLTLEDSIEKYFDNYRPKSVSLSETFKIRKMLLHLFFISVCIVLIYFLYN